MKIWELFDICDKQLMNYQLFIQFRCVFACSYVFFFKYLKVKEVQTKFSVLFTLFDFSDTVKHVKSSLFHLD